MDNRSKTDAQWTAGAVKMVLGCFVDAEVSLLTGPSYMGQLEHLLGEVALDKRPELCDAVWERSAQFYTL